MYSPSPSTSLSAPHDQRLSSVEKYDKIRGWAGDWRQWRDGQALLSVFLPLLYFAIVEAFMYVEGVLVLVAATVWRTPMNARQDQRFDSKNNDWWLGGGRKGFLGSIIGWIGWPQLPLALPPPVSKVGSVVPLRLVVLVSLRS